MAMQLHFVKYHGTGNDFILLDDRVNAFDANPGLIAYLCDRHLGIGADGLILLRESQEADFEMIYFNSDGTAASFCGNGGRCIVAFARKLGIIGDACQFKATDAMHHAAILVHSHDEMLIKIEMQDPVIYEAGEAYTYLNTGTYHYVENVMDLDDPELMRRAEKIRYDVRFAPHGTNVNFVVTDGKDLFIRTYEKGVEDETLSCGTGVTAAAIAASLHSPVRSWTVHSRGGALQVHLEKENDSFHHVYLQGTATKVFEGTISI